MKMSRRSIKLPRHNVFVPVRAPAAYFCSRDNFQNTFRISFIFGRIDGPAYGIPDWILVDFCRDLDLELFKIKC